MQSSDGHRGTRQFQVRNTLVSVGRYTYGFETLRLMDFDCFSSVKIGSFCSIASDTTVFVADRRFTHRQHAISTYPFGEIFQEDLGPTPALPEEELWTTRDGTVTIGNDVWLGYQLTILPGVKIGDGAVVAARSHVTKDVQPYEVVGGNPIRHMKYRFDEEVRELLLRLRWWELPVSAIRTITLELWRAPTAAGVEALIRRFENVDRIRDQPSPN